MATCAPPLTTDDFNVTAPREKKWSYAALLKEIKRYLWRYGCATDVETDPIELLRQAYVALDAQEAQFEHENAEDSTKIEQLEKDNKALKDELAKLKAKLPPWWQG